jgi:cell division protein FtsQ
MSDKGMTLPIDIRLMNGLAGLLLLGVMVGTTYALMAWVARLPLFNLAGITVTGQVHHSNAVTLKANVLPQLTGSFFTVDLQQTRQIFQQLPWIRQATVEREFPNRLHVHLQEHQPLAYWGAPGDERLINTLGEIFEPNLGELDNENLPRLSGPDAQSALVLQSYNVLNPMFTDLGQPINWLELSARGSWRVHTQKGAVMELGRGNPDELKERMLSFFQSIEEATLKWGRKPSAVEYADLRHENGYALRLRGVTTSEPKKLNN